MNYSQNINSKELNFPEFPVNGQGLLLIHSKDMKLDFVNSAEHVIFRQYKHVIAVIILFQRTFKTVMLVIADQKECNRVIHPVFLQLKA